MKTNTDIKKRGKNQILKDLKPYFFILPAVVFLFFWTYKPLIGTLHLSFYKWTMVPGVVPKYNHLKNFTDLFSNKYFGPALSNTLYYTLGLIPFSVIIPLFIATATQNVGKKAQKIYRALFFMPMIMPPVAISLIFQWLLHPSHGLVNKVLINMHIITQGIAFFSDVTYARAAILFVAGWKIIGFSTLMFSAALSSVNTQYYEASRMDGARSKRQFFDITVPLISPTIILMLMMSLLFASQWTFAYIDILTGGGPYGGASTNIYYLMYTYGFNDMNVGLSSASSIVFLAIFIVIAQVMMYMSRKLSFYDN